MKFSEQWLREWVNPALTTEQLAAQMTMAGLEVGGIEPVADQFTGVVVGEILSVEPHPDAAKLKLWPTGLSSRCEHWRRRRQSVIGRPLRC